MNQYDVIVIGAGVNGLATAALLAKAGRRALVLERRDKIGGTLVTEEIFAGFKFDTLAHDLGWVNPKLIRALGLHLDWIESDAAAFTPLDEIGLILYRDPVKSAESIRRFSERDAKNFPAFSARALKLASFLASIYATNAPDAFARSPFDLLPMAGLGLRLKALGDRDMLEMIRAIPVSVTEWLDDTFESDALKGTLGASGITNFMQGPRSTGTTFVFLHHHAGAKTLRAIRRPRGGVGAFASALADAAKRFGAEVRIKAEVTRILVKDNRAVGVVLASGEEIGAAKIVSALDPRTTFFDLIEPKQLSAEFARDVRNIKFKGVRAKVNLALSELPKFKGADESALQGVISISPSLRYLEDAYDEAKYGALSSRPYIEAIIPTLGDPSLAPAGKHILSVWLQFAPFHLKGGWDDSRRKAVGDLAINTLAQYAPNLKSAILHQQVLTPVDIESGWGASEGHLYHGELTLDQILFMRPVGGHSKYSTPISGLYLCGAGTHPGGGLAGAAGWLASKEILKSK
jgi:phytoene dehydrogenase-like protein